MAMLLIIEPTGASIALLLFGIFGLILFYLTKSLSARWGETRQKKEAQRLEAAQNGYSGVKEIKLYERENILLMSLIITLLYPRMQLETKRFCNKYQKYL